MSVQEIREFLGLTGFYRWFVERGTRQFVWIADLGVAFEGLKRTLTTAPILSRSAMDNREVTFHCDASKFAVGAMLLQWQEGVDRVIAYYSHKLMPVETHYAAYDRELLALKESRLHWWFFAQGNHVMIHIDHQALEQILKQHTLSNRQFGALVSLSNFNNNGKYIQGACNIMVDRLSRRSDYVSQEYSLHTKIDGEGSMLGVEGATER